jgi:hypothetical protein
MFIKAKWKVFVLFHQSPSDAIFELEQYLIHKLAHLIADCVMNAIKESKKKYLFENYFKSLFRN